MIVNDTWVNHTQALIIIIIMQTQIGDYFRQTTLQFACGLHYYKDYLGCGIHEHGLESSLLTAFLHSNECSLLSTDCAKWIWFQFQILLFSWTLTCSLISIFNLKNGPELWYPQHSHWYLDEKLWSGQWEVRSRTATGLPNSFFSDFLKNLIGFDW